MAPGRLPRGIPVVCFDVLNGQTGPCPRRSASNSLPGNIAGKSLPVPNMRLPMACYVAGLIACGLAFLASYLTQFWLYNESIGNLKSGRHAKYQIAGIIFALLGLAAFAVGSCIAAGRF